MKDSRTIRLADTASFFTALVAVGILAALVLPGIDWGLPSPERNELTLGPYKSQWDAPKLSDIEATSPWRSYPNMLPGGPERTGEFPRSAFNPLRSYHPDEYVFLKSLSSMRPGEMKLFPGFFGWPALHFYVVGAALKAASLTGYVTLTPEMHYYFQNPDAMARLYIVGRFVTFLMAAGAILMTWAAANRLLGPAPAAAAALLLAVAPLFTINARYMTADVPMLFWLSVVLYFSARILSGGSRSVAPRRLYIYAGIALGLAAATRYQGALGAFMIAAAHFLRPEAEGARRKKFLSSRDIWVAAGCSILVFFICNPYIFRYPGDFLRELTSETAGGIGGNGKILFYFLHVESALGLLFAALAAVALFLAFARRDCISAFILLGLGIPAVLLLAGMPTMTRYFMPVLLLPVLLAAWGFNVIHRRAIERGVKGARLVAPLLLVPPFLYTGLQSFTTGLPYILPQCDTRMAAGEEITKWPAGVTIGVVSDPWQFELPPIDTQKYRIVILDPSLGRAALTGPDAPQYIVTSDLQAPPLAARPEKGKEKEFWDAVRNGGEGYVLLSRYEYWPLGRKSLLVTGPQDMRYANPVIYIDLHSVGSR